MASSMIQVCIAGYSGGVVVGSQGWVVVRAWSTEAWRQGVAVPGSGQQSIASSRMVVAGAWPGSSLGMLHLVTVVEACTAVCGMWLGRLGCRRGQ